MQSKSSKKIQQFLSYYGNYQFESSIGKTKEFSSFATKFKNLIKSIANEANPNFVLEDYNVGHFYVSGFIKNTENDKFVYFSISDVRCPSLQQYVLNNILIRTAQHNKDFTGGANNFVDLHGFGFELANLLQ